MIFKLTRFLPVTLMVVAIFLFALPALAQGGEGVLPDTLPGSAAEGVEVIALFLAGLAGLLATAVTDAIKNLPFLKEEDKSKLSGPMADLVAAVVSIGSAYAVGYLGQLAGFLDESGLWQVILFSWPAAKGWYEVTALRRNTASKEGLGPVAQRHIARTLIETDQPKAPGKHISGIFPKDIEATLQRGGYFTVEGVNKASDGELIDLGLSAGAVDRIREMLAGGITIADKRRK